LLPFIPHAVSFFLQVAEFPVFTRSGEENVSFTYCGEHRLTPEQLEKVKAFHKFVFNNILRIEKCQLKFNLEQAEYSLLLAPIHSGE